MNDLDDLPTFLGAAGCLYVKADLCTPFHLKGFAEAWRSDGISVVHCLEQIRSHLAKNARFYRNGSGDWGLRWLDADIRQSWHLRRPPPAMLVVTDGLYERSIVDDSDEWPLDLLDRAPNEAQPIDLKPIEVASEGEIKDARSHPGQMPASPTIAYGGAVAAPIPVHPICLMPIDKAEALLLRELADGEVEARIIEEKAKAENISPRTLDRARARLKVVSRRTGYGKNGQYWLELPRSRRVRGRRDGQIAAGQSVAKKSSAGADRDRR